MEFGHRTIAQASGQVVINVAVLLLEALQRLLGGAGHIEGNQGLGRKALAFGHIGHLTRLHIVSLAG